MSRALTHGSLFSGIGGFDKGFHDAGIETVWAVEKEPFCRAVLKTHFPKITIFEDVCNVGINELFPVDVISGGFPCQDVSVAGKRRGLAGERTGLFYEAAGILCELRPTWFVFENVPGLLSSNGGRDFAEILRVLMVDCGYGVCWRVLDSQFFGVAQRRNRLFIVGRFGEPCPASVLFEPESGERIATQGRDQGERTATGPRGGVVGCLAARDYKGADNIFAEEGKLVPIAFGANDDGRDVSFDISPTLRCGGIGGGGVHTGVAIYSGSQTDTHGIRDFAGLPEGMDAPRYRALGNAVTTKVASWIGRRIVEASNQVS